VEKFSGPSFQWIDVTELLSTTPVKHPYLGVSAGLILRARRSIVQSWQGALVSLTSKGTLELAPLRHCGRTVREHTMWGRLYGTCFDGSITPCDAREVYWEIVYCPVPMYLAQCNQLSFPLPDRPSLDVLERARDRGELLTKVTEMVIVKETRWSNQPQTSIRNVCIHLKATQAAKHLLDCGHPTLAFPLRLHYIVHDAVTCRRYGR